MRASIQPCSIRHVFLANGALRLLRIALIGTLIIADAVVLVVAHHIICDSGGLVRIALIADVVIKSTRSTALTLAVAVVAHHIICDSGGLVRIALIADVVIKSTRSTTCAAAAARLPNPCRRTAIVTGECLFRF